MDEATLPDARDPGQAKARGLATALTVHGVVGLCLAILLAVPVLASRAPAPPPWLPALLIGIPVLCLLGGVLLRACRNGARPVASLALIGLLPFWGVVTLPITGGLIFFFVYGLEGTGGYEPPNRFQAELPYYIGHAVFWLLAWYFIAGRHLRWLWSPAVWATFTATARAPLRTWRSLRLAFALIALFAAGTVFFTVRHAYVTATADAGFRHDFVYLRKVWPLAARDGNLDLVKLALEYGADINAHDGSEGEETALHGAVKNGRLQVVRYLVAHGADTRARNWRGETPRDYARKAGRADLLRALLQ